MTLVETLITVALIAVMAGMAMMSLAGAGGSAKLRRGSTQIAGAVRIAYAHATATSKVVRLAFDFEGRRVLLEEAESRHLIDKDDAGGAEAATELEMEAQAAAELLTKGPRPPRASFSAVETLGFPLEGRELPEGIQFWSIDVEHQESALREGHSYLYFFPGGQTEAAGVQLRIAKADESDDTSYMTVFVAPLTGLTKIKKGRVDMPRPRDEREASDREDPGS